ncbi:MAG: hypothetical protein K6E85_13260 [Lachnospiraceae bacterium]|nr:hypothetical protein [Lachnospiraceae bacterium]
MAINGISSGDSGNYFASMLGTKSSTQKSSSSNGLDAMLGSSGTSAMSGLGDYAMIQNGAYRKLLNAYYNKKDTTEETAEQKAEKINLTTSSADASSLNQDVNKLMAFDVTEDNRASIKESIRSVVDKYNALIDSASKVDDVKVLRQALWMTQDTSALAATLEDIGVTVGSNNKLTFNEEKFDNAQLTSISTAVTGRGSYFSKLADRSATLNNAAQNAVSGTSAKSMYKSNGDYAKKVSGNNIDKTE